ncbi:MAG: peptidylprolyl isomerase [Pseudomonadota bacterium]
MREEIRVNMGLETYMDRLWQQIYPTEEKRLELIKENRQFIEGDYMNVSHIFFNVFQDPWFQIKPDVVMKQKMNAASSIWKRLEHGENFEAVAKEVSEDKISRENGGALGCVRKNIFGLEFSKAATELAFGQYSKPVQSIWGAHIIKRNEITDKDILNILKQQFQDEKQLKIITKLMNEAKVVRYDKEK